MFVKALVSRYTETNTLTALCDVSQTRMDWHNRRLSQRYGANPVATYPAEDFDQMLTDIKPQTVIVCTPDALHHEYIIRALDAGCDVITEKPLTTDADKLQAIFDAIERSGQRVRVTFNYRFAPAYTQLRQIMADGVIGQPLNVDFSWLLDVHHGADYFRRWHREKEMSGGLLVHKATHHFDLVNWWIDAFPYDVFTMSELKFYGKENARQRGETYDYNRYTGHPAAENDPFALHLDRDEDMAGLYLEAEAETGYLRDRNVFGEPVDIEDTMCVVVRYDNGVLMSYNLIAYAPWEGLRVAITGTKGRVELDIIERIEQTSGNQEGINLAASKGAFDANQLRVYPQFAPPYEVEIPAAEGGHGGADPLMLEQIFAPNPPPDPLHRNATHIDGAASIMLGIAANESIVTGQPVRIDDLFPLPRK
jgi:predicted dehydrogenase